MFVSTEVADVLDPPWADTREGRLFARLEALLTGFVEGDYLTVGEDPFNKDSGAILARVHPVEEEIWDFRCLDPKPGIRAFGCFAEKDTFIALTWDYRENLDDCWSEVVADCKAEWKKLFGDLPPFGGPDLDAYLTYNFRSV